MMYLLRMHLLSGLQQRRGENYAHQLVVANGRYKIENSSPFLKATRESKEYGAGMWYAHCFPLNDRR